jgi:hypothetical protein
MVSLWKQVDRAMRLDAPWLEMQKGYTVAERSVLLDYISPILPSALWSAIRNRHWRVSGAILVLGLAKLAILFSTGLLVVQETLHTETDRLIALKKLTGATWDPSTHDFYANELYANLVYNVTFPPGVTEQAAFQELDDTRNQFPLGSIVTAQVLAFFPDLECREAALSFSYAHDVSALWLGDHDSYITNNTMSVDISSDGYVGDLMPFSQPECSHQNWTACDFDSTYIGTTSVMGWEAGGKGPNYQGPSNAVVVTLVKVTKDPSSPDTGYSRVLWSSAIVCGFKYAVETANLTVNTSNPSYPDGKKLSAPTSSTGYQLPGYAPSNLTADFDLPTYEFVQSTAIQELIAASNPGYGIDYTNLDIGFQLMLTLKADHLVDQLRQSSVLVNATTALFKALTAQSVARWLSFPDHLVTNGSYVFSEQRLLVQPSAALEMCAVLALALIVIVALIRSTPRHRSGPVYRPICLTALAATGGKDKTLTKLLSTAGHKTDVQLVQSLASSKFTLSCSQRGRSRLDVNEEGSTPEDDSHRTTADGYNMKWWTPISAQRWFACLCLLVPLAEIATLEVLQRRTRAHDGQGICDINQSLETVHYLVSLVPAALMLITAALYSSTDFAISIIAPNNRLKKGMPRCKRMNQNHADDLAPLGIAKCVLRGEYATFAILISTTLASVLTIIVSGLYAVTPVTRPYRTNILTTDQFNPSWNQLSADTSNMELPLLEAYILSWPSGVFESFAYPRIQLDLSDATVARVLAECSSAYFDVTLPVLRPTLNCSLVPQSEKYYGPMEVYDKQDSQDPGLGYVYNTTGVGFGVTAELPEHCQFSSGSWQYSSKFMLNSTTVDALVASIIALTTVDGNSLTFPTNDYPPYCPSLSFGIGPQPNDGHTTKDWTVFVCTQQQEEVPVLLRFNLGLELDTTFSPQIDESRAKVVSAYQYDLVSLFNVNDYEGGALANGADTFYTNVLGYTGLTLDDMAGPGKEEVFFNATRLMYQYFMALTFGDAMRIRSLDVHPTNNVSSVTQAGSTFVATLHNPLVLRVSQENTSKVILQVLLSIMVVCYIIAYLSVDMRHTLPHNPCSIAGALSLVLGGNFAKEAGRLDDDIAHWEQHGDEIVAEKMAETRLRLAWWETEPGQPARFGIDMVVSAPSEDGEEMRPL